MKVIMDRQKYNYWKHCEFIGNISRGTFLRTSKSCKYLLNTKIVYMYPTFIILSFQVN